MKNKGLFYLALAIGGAFLIHKFMMSKVSDKTATPGTPGTPPPNVVPGNVLTQSSIKSMAINEILNSDNSQNALTNVHPINEYDVANTYQNFYGRSISGMYKTCPTII
jgi:hypothetical protein